MSKNYSVYDAEIRKLCKKGLKVPAIAKKLDLNSDTLRQYIYRNSISFIKCSQGVKRYEWSNAKINLMHEMAPSGEYTLKEAAHRLGVAVVTLKAKLAGYNLEWKTKKPTVTAVTHKTEIYVDKTPTQIAPWPEVSFEDDIMAAPKPNDFSLPKRIFYRDCM